MTNGRGARTADTAGGSLNTHIGEIEYQGTYFKLRFRGAVPDDFEAWISERDFAVSGLEEGNAVAASWAAGDVHWLGGGTA